MFIPQLQATVNRGSVFSWESEMDQKEFASMGGLARTKKLSKAERDAISRKGGINSRGKPRKRSKAKAKNGGGN
jgi:hypothetical protein